MRLLHARLGTPILLGAALSLVCLSTGRGGEAPAAQAAGRFEWFFTFNGPVAGDAGDDMAVDAEGNVFVAGHQHGLDNDRDGRLEVQSSEADVFFAKFSQRPDDTGVVLEWIRSPSTPDWNQVARVAPDRQGGLYGGGRFRGTLSFGSDRTLEGAGGNDGFLVRYDAAGDVAWTHAFGGPADDAVSEVDSDAVGNAYIIGLGSGSFPLDDRGARFEAGSGGDGPTPFVASYDAQGTLRWIHPMGGPAVPKGLTVEPDGEVLVSGDLTAPADLDGDGRIDLPAPPDRDGFVARFDREGRFVGGWSIGSAAAWMAPAEDGDVFVLSGTGETLRAQYGPADFDGDGAPDVAPKAGLAVSPVVARYSREGRLRWVRSYVLERPTSLVTDGERLVMTGGYHGVLDLDEDGVPEAVDRTVDPARESELAVLILSTRDGRPEEVWTAPGPGRDFANSAVFLPGRPIVYVTGYIQLTADFTGDGEDGEGWATCEARGDFFFARYRLDAAEPSPCAITLEATGRRDTGPRRFFADLSWTGGPSGDVDVYRNGVRIATTPNGGSFTDEIPSEEQGPYVYRIAPAGSEGCFSNEVTVGF